MCTFQISNTI